jgi:DNA-binding winged helix-turn-helix (wHTH) protein
MSTIATAIVTLEDGEGIPSPGGGFALTATVFPPQAAVMAEEQLRLVPGGFSYRGGPVINLPGKPLAVLQELLKSPYRRVDCDHLLATVWGVDSMGTKQNVIDVMMQLRAALRKATKRREPLPCVSRGGFNPAWELVLR